MYRKSSFMYRMRCILCILVPRMHDSSHSTKNTWFLVFYAELLTYSIFFEEYKECSLEYEESHYPNITRSRFDTSPEGFFPREAYGLTREALSWLGRCWVISRLPSAKTKLNQRLPRNPKTRPSITSPEGLHQTIPTSPEYQKQTIFTSPEEQNQTISTPPEYQNQTIFIYQRIH